MYYSNSEATLYLSLLKTTDVKVELYNILGQKVSDVFKGELSGQNHAIPFSIANLPSGAYYCAVFKNGGEVEMVPVRIAR
ncbi:MAG TPA: T9SS type A sorting domain-containing protein [Patescibacteria group bacterium]|nr:T9SS type A sorting domain-containing protein [Patescibacteria group bacterium]